MLCCVGFVNSLNIFDCVLHFAYRREIVILTTFDLSESTFTQQLRGVIFIPHLNFVLWFIRTVSSYRRTLQFCKFHFAFLNCTCSTFSLPVGKCGIAHVRYFKVHTYLALNASSNLIFVVVKFLRGWILYFLGVRSKLIARCKIRTHVSLCT